jgi:hypothetical protein
MAYQKLQVGRAANVTTSDSQDIPSVSGGENNGCVLYVGTGGNVRVTTVGYDDVVFSNVPSGSFIPVQVLKVWATNTTALNIIALW